MRGNQGGQPRQMQPYGNQRNMLGDRMPQMDNRAAMAQQRRNQSFSQRQNPQNLYQGQGAGHLSAVMGSNLGVGDPNRGYILHDFGNGQYAYNQGNLDPTLVNLTGDYSKWFK